jgi:metal-responsive CopG/Arc/MetJ family transcriptional regulator
MAQKKIQISFPPAIAEQMDAYCKQNDLNRSGFVTMAVASYLTANQAIGTLNALYNLFIEMKTDGVTDEKMQELEKIEGMLAVLNGRA